MARKTLKVTFCSSEAVYVFSERINEMKLVKAIVHLIFLVAFNSGASLIGHLPSPTRVVFAHLRSTVE